MAVHFPSFVPGFSCNKRYVFGVFSVKMKLPANYSGGVIPCMYMTSPGTTDFRVKHDEIDFEFLGGTSPQNITIHTNLISDGWQKLEQVRECERGGGSGTGGGGKGDQGRENFRRNREWQK